VRGPEPPIQLRRSAATGGTGPFCNDFVYTYLYDADALPLSIGLVVNGSSRAPLEFVTLETGLICR
jgi:hypothetical protein